MDKFAVISDVHGNRWALEVVLEDIQKQNIKTIFNLGDVVYGPLDPAGTADILMGLDIPTVAGNEDRMIIDQQAKLSPTLEYVRRELRKEHLDWLETLPLTLKIDDYLLFHGTTNSNTTYLLWGVNADGAYKREQGEVQKEFDGVKSKVILCGHDHVPGAMKLSDGRLVVNPGSVGLQAYDDDFPHPHVMGSGSPHTRYAVMTDTSAGWKVVNHTLPYDWQAAAVTALKNGRLDWAEWLKTGWALI